MAKLSLGDYGINTQVADNSLGSGYTLEEMIEKGEKKYPSIETTEQTITANPSINNAIAIQRNQDGSLKYTFDNIYDNKQLVSVAKDYYTNRSYNSIKFSNAENSLVSFFMQLTRYLQQAIGTVPAIDLNKYLKSINEKIDEDI